MKTLRVSAALSALVAASSSACDLCAIYSATQAHGDIGKGPFLGVVEQYTRFATVQLDGHEIPNEAGQFLNSSVAQTFVGYNFNNRIGLQFNAPVIYRRFRRPDGIGGIQTGTVYGLGDVSLLGNFTPYMFESRKATFRWSLTGGIKCPTGDSALLAEEFNEVEDPVGPPNGIHGHDLALGSSSWDGIIGTYLFGRINRLFVNANVQYVIRSTGAFDYRYANDFTWSVGPGCFAVLNENWTLGVQAIVSGEHKGLDTFQGMSEEDTGITAVYVGPQFNFTWQDKLSAFVGADLPVVQDNTALQTVANYRIRGGVTWHF